MSKLETNTIDTVSGTTNLTIGGANNTGSTTIKTNNTDAVTIDNSQNLQFNSGYGSVATAYGCRLWIQLNQEGTQSITGSGNVSSITDTGVGDTTINFANAMPDDNYSAVGMNGDQGNQTNLDIPASGMSSSSLQVGSRDLDETSVDASLVNVAIFR